MSDLVGNPEDLFSHVAAHIDDCLFVVSRVIFLTKCNYKTDLYVLL